MYCFFLPGLHWGLRHLLYFGLGLRLLQGRQLLAEQQHWGGMCVQQGILELEHCGKYGNLCTMQQ